MKQYNITGMSCAACQARVEKAVNAVPGVTGCSVSLLTNSMGVEGTANENEIIKAVKNAGYGAFVKESSDPLDDKETPKLKKRLISSIVILLVLLYFSMGHMLFGFPVPSVLAGNPPLAGLLQLVLCAAVIIINKKFFVSGIKGVVHGAPNMDTLVALGSGVSFLWSVYVLIKMFISGAAEQAELMNSLYFESAAMILTLITVGKTLEAHSKGKTTNALKALINLAPKTANVVREGKEIEIPASEVIPGDIFTVRPGGGIPVDGTVINGSTAVNEAALTGESMPVDKTEGDSVSAGTVNLSGFVTCKATRTGEDTTLSQIIRLVSDAAATKAPAAKAADKVAAVFVPAVLAVSVITLSVWLLLGRPVSFALARAISVLVISCPCALGLATPVAVTVGSGAGAKHGILFKTAASLEQTGKISIAVLDKTGTVTKGEPEVRKIIPADTTTETELLTAAFTLEAKSEHPIALAIKNEAEKRGIIAEETKSFEALPGSGLKAETAADKLTGGSYKFISALINANGLEEQCTELSKSGLTPVCFLKNGALLGVIAVADSVKPDSAQAVKRLKDMGISVVMLTGDNLNTAKAAGAGAGIENIVAGVLPAGKAKVIERLKTLGRTAMIGDGINDAPALTVADTGMAIGAGTDVAVDSADVVLMNSRLSDVAAAVSLSRAVLRNIHENLFWAFFYNVLAIPLAAGCYINLLGLQMSPAAGAAAMSLSSFCVVANALRLNLFDPYSVKNDKRKNKSAVNPAALTELINEINSETEENYMTKTIKIEGMMCPHCEARVKKVLEALDGVESAEASHTAGTAVLTLSAVIPDEKLKNTVEEQGYTVLGID